MKKALALFVVAICLTSSIFILSACENKGDLWLDSVVIDAVLNEDGDLAVSETWVAGISSPEGYRNLYKTINLFDADFGKAHQIEISGVRDNDNGKELERAAITRVGEYEKSNFANTWYLFPTGGNDYEFGVIMPRVERGKRSFTFNYTISDAVGGYADTSVLYWRQFNDASSYVGDYKCTIHLPNTASTEGTFAWFHTEAESMLEVKPDSLYYTASEIPAGVQIETRLAMPTDLFGTLAKQSDKAALQSIKDEEQAWADAWAKELAKRRTNAILQIVFSVVFVVGAAVLVVVMQITNKKAKGDFPKYLRDIPNEWTAGELGHLFYYYDGGVEKKNLRGRLLSATMLELARRNYIEIIPTADDDYKIHVNDVTGAKADDMKPYERTLFGLLDRVERQTGHEFTMDEFEKYAKKNYSDIDASINDFNTKSKDWFRRGGFVGKASQLYKTCAFAGIGMAGIGAFITVYVAANIFSIALIVAGIILLIGVPKLAKLNKKGEEEYARAAALKQYMLDFSNLKEYDIPKLILWEEYLVYATMMNISKEVVNNLKLVYPEISRELDRGGSGYHRPTGSYLFTYLWLSRSMRVGASAFDLGSRMERSITNIRNTAHALKYPSNKGGGGFGGGGFGGGGFRGGGGGFGGGSFGGRH